MLSYLFYITIFYLPIAICIPIKSNDVITISALDHTIWDSTAIITFYQDDEDAVQCQFTNIAIDFSTIYFIVSDPMKRQQAAHDIFNCCVNIIKHDEIDERKCKNSVRSQLCSCFYPFKYVPSVISPENAKKKFMPLHGKTWLMHHWSEWHHIDHYTMKVLELQNLLYNAKHVKDMWFSELPAPESIDQLLSMDYDGTPSGDSFETMFSEMLYTVLGRKPHYFVNKNGAGKHLRHLYFASDASLKPLRRVLPLCEYVELEESTLGEDLLSLGAKIGIKHNAGEYMSNLLGIGNSTLRKLLLEDRDGVFPVANTLAEVCLEVRIMRIIKLNQAMPLHNCGRGACQPYFLDHAYMSPVYKNNIPCPYESSAESVKYGFRKYLEAYHSKLYESVQCVSNLTASASVKVAILQRFEGSGTRSFVNLDRMLLSIYQITSQESIEIMFISSKTPAHIQALKFCSFHILIAPHSSQLSNLIFTPAGVSIIELQNEKLIEDTFLWLGERMNLHYQRLKQGNIAVSGENNVPDSVTHPKMANQLVHISNFEKALDNALQNLRENGFVA